MGIEPAINIAKVASGKGIPTLTEFFGSACARRLRQAGRSADLIVGNNVLAQVPALNDFVDGLRILLSSHPGSQCVLLNRNNSKIIAILVCQKKMLL